MNLNRRQFIVGAGAAAVASLSACSQQSASSSAKAESAQLTKIDFCLDYAPNTNHTGIYVADALGYYDEVGIELNIFQSAEDAAEAIIGTGKAPLGVSYQDYIANVLAADEPLPITAVAAIVQHNTSGIMSKGDLGVNSPAKMEGKRYATWELPVELATVKNVVEADGGDFSKVQLVPYTVDDEVAGIRADLFDCVWVFEGWAVQNAIVQDEMVSYFSFISINDVFDFYTPVIAANADWAMKNGDVLTAFLGATRKGYEYAIANPDKAADILLEAVPELDEKLVRASQEYLASQYQSDADRWGIIDDDRWQRFYQWLNDEKLVENPIDPTEGYTMSYLKAAD